VSQSNSKPPQVSLVAVLSSLRRAFVGVGLISALVNVLALTGSFFMLQVYDRVIPGHCKILIAARFLQRGSD
jgi:ATP-binding cassette subfamily C protein